MYFVVVVVVTVRADVWWLFCFVLFVTLHGKKTTRYPLSSAACVRGKGKKKQKKVCRQPIQCMYVWCMVW